MAFPLSLTRTSLTGAEAGGSGTAPAGPSAAHCTTHPSSRVGVRVVCRPAAAAAAVIAADQEQVPEAAGGADAAAVASPDQLAPAVVASAAVKGGAARKLFAASPQAAPPRAARKASLRLLPVEPPARCGTPNASGPWLPDGSPRLESPLHRLHSQWLRAAAGLEEGRAPRLAPAGTGGAYFLVDKAGAFVAVFKPVDEEPLAVNNPKGRRGSSGSVVAAGSPPPPPAAVSPAATAASITAPDGGPWSLAALTTALRDAAAAAAAKGAAGALVGGAWGAAPGEGLRRGLRPGEGAVREVAAYLLDYNGFSGVPPTAMVRLELGTTATTATAVSDTSSPADAGDAAAAAAKVGSLQAFVDAEADCEEMGVSGFPVPEVHKIAVLDLRLGNTDRHAANILARRGAGGAWELTPIDHGCCLPDSFEDLYFEWATWPQAQVPFDEPTRAYISALDADRDAAALSAHGLELRPECITTLRVTTALLQKGAAAGLTPAQIAGIASRQSAASPSPLERMHAAACAAAAAPCGDAGAACGVDEPAYLRRMHALIDTAVADAALDAPGALLL